LFFPPENFRILADNIPGAKLYIFKDAPHAFTREKEDEVIAVILEFLEGVNQVII
jgi:pimeloyl-ACP methyl ester carboxylesterase